MHPMIVVSGTLLTLALGFAIMYQIAKRHDRKNQI